MKRIGLLSGVVLAVLCLGCGGSDSPTEPVNPPPVNNPPPANGTPTARITASPTSIPAGDNHQTVVTLDGTGSSDPDGDPLTFAWTALDANFVMGTTPASATAKVTFPGSAPYPVTLTVNDGRGGQNTANTTILLGP